MIERQENHPPEINRCPLCAADNRCAVAMGAAPESCWCHSSRVKPSALAALPENERMQRCICPDCAGVTEGL